MSRYSFREMTQADAEVVAAWRYEPPYDFYDFESDAEDLAEILDPEQRARDYHSVEADGELVGFFSFKLHGDELEVGLGLRPDLTGKGVGSEFVDAGLDFAREKFGPRAFWLDVATWNERAKKVYERAGFEAGHVWTQTTRPEHVDFLRMSRPS